MRQDRRRYREILLTVLLCVMLGISGCNGSSEVASREGTEKKREVQESLEVHFLDVGQGDSTLIKAGDHAMPMPGRIIRGKKLPRIWKVKGWRN